MFSAEGEKGSEIKIAGQSYTILRVYVKKGNP
jgi:hypothetical protein